MATAPAAAVAQATPMVAASVRRLQPPGLTHWQPRRRPGLSSNVVAQEDAPPALLRPSTMSRDDGRKHPAGEPGCPARRRAAVLQSCERREPSVPGLLIS